MNQMTPEEWDLLLSSQTGGLSMVNTAAPVTQQAYADVGGDAGIQQAFQPQYVPPYDPTYGGYQYPAAASPVAEPSYTPIGAPVAGPSGSYYSDPGTARETTAQLANPDFAWAPPPTAEYTQAVADWQNQKFAEQGYSTDAASTPERIAALEQVKNAPAWAQQDVYEQLSGIPQGPGTLASILGAVGRNPIVQGGLQAVGADVIPKEALYPLAPLAGLLGTAAVAPIIIGGKLMGLDKYFNERTTNGKFSVADVYQTLDRPSDIAKQQTIGLLGDNPVGRTTGEVLNQLLAPEAVIGARLTGKGLLANLAGAGDLSTARYAAMIAGGTAAASTAAELGAPAWLQMLLALPGGIAAMSAPQLAEAAARGGGRALRTLDNAFPAERVFAAGPEFDPKAAAAGGADRPVYEMSLDEIATARIAAQNEEKFADVTVFGWVGAKRYQAAQRTANSMTASRPAQDAAQKVIDEMEAGLNTEQQRILFGIGETGPNAEELSAIERAMGSLDWESPEALGASLRWAITNVDPRANPATLAGKELTSYMQLKHALEGAQAAGWDTRVVSEAAIRGSASRFSPEDANFMLSRFRQTPTPPEPVAGLPASAVPALEGEYIPPSEVRMTGQQAIDEGLRRGTAQANAAGAGRGAGVPPAAPPLTQAAQPPIQPPTPPTGATTGGATGGGAPPARLSGIAEAETAARNSVAKPGAFIRNTIGRGLVALRNPVVNIANSARRYVIANAGVFIAPADDAMKAMSSAFDRARPVFIGAANDVTATTNTWTDFLERPWLYKADPALVQARQSYDAAMEANLQLARDRYGVEINTFARTGPDGQVSSYVPHIEDPKAQKRRLKGVEKGPEQEYTTTGKVNIQETRGHASIGQRMAETPDWFPVTDPSMLASYHGQQLAEAAGRATYIDLIPGKTETELLWESNPALMRARKAATANVTKTKRSLANVQARLKQAGIDDARIQREIKLVRERMSAAAGRIEGAIDELPEVTALREELDNLRAEAEAYSNLASRAGGAESAANAMNDARNVLETAQKKAAQSLGLSEEALANTRKSNQLRMTPEEATASIQARKKGLEARIAGLNAVGKKLVPKYSKLMDDAARLKAELDSMPRPTANNIRALEGNVLRAENTLLQRVSRETGAQGELGVQGTRLANQSKRVTDITDAARQRIDDLATRLDAESVQLAEARTRVKAADTHTFINADGKREYWARDPVTSKWTRPEIALASKSISRSKTDNLTRLLEEGKSFQLDTGDGSVLTYGRALMGAAAYPGTAAKMGWKTLHPAIAKSMITGRGLWESVDQELLQTYQGLRGTRVQDQLPEYRPAGARGMRRIPVLGTHVISPVSDATARVATYGDFLAWESSTRRIMRTKHVGLQQAGAEAAKAIESTAARLDLTKWGFSDAAARSLNVPVTSLSYLVAAPRLAANWSSAMTKFVTKGFNWGALSGAEQETIIHGTEMVAVFSGLAAATNVAFGDPNKSIEERMLDSITPGNDDWWMLKLPFGAGSIPLGGPIRSGVGAGINAGKGDGDKVLRYFTNRLTNIPGFAYHMATQKDWTGKDILEGSTLDQVRQGILYGMESATILTSPVFNKLRTDDQTWGETGRDVGVNFIGTPYYEPRAADAMDSEARKQFDKDYDKLGSGQQAAVNATLNSQKFSDRADPWFNARNDAWKDFKRNIPADIANAPLTKQMLEAVKDDVSIDALHDVVRDILMNKRGLKDFSEADDTARDFLKRTGIADLQRQYREDVIRADPGFVVVWTKALDNGELDGTKLENDVPDWVKDLVEELTGVRP